MSQEYRYILRIMGTDVPGTLKTSYAIAQIKGVSIEPFKRNFEEGRSES